MKRSSASIGLIFGAAVLLAPLASLSQPREIASARELLEALEAADEGLESLQAQIAYDRIFVLQDDQHIRMGDLYFIVGETPEAGKWRKFAIHFKDLIFPLAGRREEDRQDWIFDGRWLVEKRPDEKRFHAREIAPEGAEFDPLRIGEGPFPVPIGQKADDILARFDAKFMPEKEGVEGDERWETFLNNTWRLHLTPKEGAEEQEDFREIDLWYSRNTLLPRLARTINRQGDISIVQMINLKRNQQLPEGVFDARPPDPSEGWDVQVERLENARAGAENQR